MRRKIALMLSVVLLIGVFRGFPTFAYTIVKNSEALGFKELSVELKDDKGTVIQKPQGIRFEQDRLQLVEGPREDEVTMEWKIVDNTAPRNGDYILEYYVEGGTTTNPKLYNVVLTYGVNKTVDNQIDVEVKVKDEKGQDVTTKYVSYKSPYGDTDIEKSEEGKSYTDTLKIGTGTVASDKELVLAIGNLSKAHMFVEENKIRLSVTGIKKDYITPFNLSYKSSEQAPVETAAFNAFKGVKDFQILPTHLTTEPGVTTNASLKLSSQTVIDLDKVVAEGELGVEAGSRPGIVVTLSKPKVLVKSNGSTPKFDTIDKVIGGNQTGKAEIYLEELLGKGTGIDGQKQLKLQFDLKDNADVIDTKDGGVKGKILTHGDRFELYLVQDKTLEGLVEDKYKDALVEWPALEEGMLLNGEISFGGTLFSDNNKTLRFKPDKVGYTYVRYYIYRFTQEDISFKVIPYNIRGPVTYTLLKAGAFGSTWDAIDIRHYQDKPTSEQITLTTKKGYQEQYKIVMNTGSSRGEFESQIVKYSGDNDTVPPPYSEIINIDNVYVTPNDFVAAEGSSTEISAVGLDVEWRAPVKETLLSYLQNGNIYYELYLSDSSNTVGKPIKVFKVFLDGNTIKLTDYAGTIKGNLEYDEDRSSFIARGVVLKDQSFASNEWEVLDIPKLEGLINYPENIKAHAEGNYTVPNTYYLTVRPVYDQNNDDTKLALSKFSNPKSIALDIVRKVLPTPETVQSKPLTDSQNRLNQAIYFSPVDLQNYVQYMLDPLGLKLHPQGQIEEYRYYRNYEIYVYQDGANTGSTEELPFDKVQEVKYTNDNGKISVELNADQKAFMREEKGALVINYDSTLNTLTGDENLHELIIKGLEANTPYYVQIRTRIDLYDQDGNAIGKKVYSVLSKIHSFTTTTKPLPPSPDEQVPPVPGRFFIDDQPNNTTVKLGWEESEFALNNKENIYYEFVRVDSAMMAQEDTSRTLDIEKVLSRNTRYKGFHTEDEFIKTYKDGNWVELDPQQKSSLLRLEDNSLRPNTIYYYYIRTVYKVAGEKVYSDWIMLPVTTSPLDKPIELKVESPIAYSHDGRYEVVVSFLAPIPKDAKVPQEFDFDIAVKGDKDEEYRLDYKKTLIKEEGNNLYRKFVYKITGLTHGTRYDIKVRIIDKTKTELIYSLYSDKVIARTDFSEEDQDKENIFNDYLEEYDREAEKLKRQPYWVVDSPSSQGIYKYRQSYMSSELALSKTYELVTKEAGKSVYYYVPNTFFDEMIKSNTLVTIKLDQYTATLRPSTLKGNEEIQEARQKVKEGRYEDFYIAIEFGLTNLTGKIQGQEVLSPEIFMNLEIIYLDQEDLLIEDKIIDNLNKLIDDGRIEVIEDLEDEIKDGKVAEATLNRIIEKALQKVVDRHMVRVEKVLDQAIEREVDLDTVQKEIYLEAAIESYGTRAYYYNRSNWEEVYTYNVGNVVAIEMKQLGSYAFVGNKGGSNLVPNIPGGSNLISKYALTDFFDVEKGLRNTVTKEKLYGAVARVLGARRGTDYILYLKDRGIKLIVPNTLYQPVRQDEAIYIIMQAYEKMYYKNINNIYISNKLQVENIGAFQPIYRPYVYGAVELGVIVPEGKKVLPSKLVTAEDVIRMLSKIVPK